MSPRRRPRYGAASALIVAAITGCSSSTPDAPMPSTATSAESTQQGVTGSASSGDSLLPGVGNGGYDVVHYDLDLAFDPQSGPGIVVSARIELVTSENLDVFHLDFMGYTIDDPVLVNGEPASIRRQGRELIVDPRVDLLAGSGATVEVNYRGEPESFVDETGIPIGIFTETWGSYIIAEPHGAAAWFPANDHPQDKATFTISVTTDSDRLGLAPGQLVSTSELADGRHRTTYTSADPMATYLAWVIEGEFDVVEADPVAGTPLRHVLPRNGGTLDLELDVLSDILESFVDWFGPYPFDQYGIAVLPDADLVPALENQTLPVFAQWVFEPGAPRQFDVRTHAHELAHQWFGNHVSLRDWGDVWLNEGFATWAEVRWLELNVTSPALTFERMAVEADYGPLLGIEADSMFDRNIYRRGALTLEALRRQIGDADFFALLRSWAERHGGSSAGTSDFLDLVDELAGADAVALVQEWLTAPRMPRLAPDE